MATTGNATDFGDMLSTYTQCGATSDATTGVWMGGYTGSIVNTIQKVTIQTTGNATDFGDLVYNQRFAVATSGASS